jgi:ABC-type transport system involved in multi-copper enzyme maturation permease subunit
MNVTLIFKEIRENKWVLLIAFLFLAVITPIYPYGYSSMLTVLLSEGTTYEKFLWYDWFLKAVPQIALAAAIITGASSIAREKKNSTLGILVTKPISRTYLFLHKLLAGSLSLVVMMAADTFLLALASPALGAQGMNGWVLLVGLLGDILLILPVYLLAVLFSTIFMSSIKAGLLSAAIMLVLYGPVWLGSEFSMVWWLLGDFGIVNLILALVLAVSGALFVWLGIYRFNRIDV